MQLGSIASRLVLSLAIACAALALSGCDSVRDAMGSTKAPPDEFTVMTAAPLIVPPDFNLRPPQPGAPARNAQDPTAQARAALYSQTPESAAAALGSSYSDGEKLLLARSGAANVDPSIRQTLSTETGYDATDPSMTDRVLSGSATAPAPGAAATQPAPPAAPAPAATPSQ